MVVSIASEMWISQDIYFVDVVVVEPAFSAFDVFYRE
jgi:hypothetical protein